MTENQHKSWTSTAWAEIPVVPRPSNDVHGRPFRTSGTAFELGFASALGVPVIAYFADARALAEKVAAAQHRPLQQTASGLRDADQMAVEDFGLPLNLMLAVSARLVVGDVRVALAVLEGFNSLDESNSRQI